MSEFCRIYDLRSIPILPVELRANDMECAALAQRFGLVAVNSFGASVTLSPDGPAITVCGTLTADIVQICAVSGEDLAVAMAEPVTLRFVPAGSPSRPDEEIELEANELDEIAMIEGQFDLGEALAQGLGLAIDPYAEGPGAEEARRKAGIVNAESAGPFAALAALKKDLK